MRIKRYLGFFLAVWLICQIPLAFAEAAAPKGTGEAGAVFSVQSSGGARLTLRQERGRCGKITFNMKKIIKPGQTPVPKDSKEKNQYVFVPASTSYMEIGAWGQYRLIITDPSGKETEKEWGTGQDGAEITLFLPRAGLYRIRVIPFSQQEMNESWLPDRFVRWIAYPEWEVADTINCECVE